MPYLLNLAYFLIFLVLSPWLLYKSLTTGKYRRGMWSKLTGRTALPAHHSPLTTHHSPLTTRHSPLTTRQTIWFHGVSVGEIHLLRPLLAAFRRRHPDWQCVISSTTDTGYDEACKRFVDLRIIYWPLDFSWAVRAALDDIKPDVVVLAEAELWPNFLTAAKQRGVPVAVINGRMSPHSFTRWQWLKRSPFSFLLFPFSLIDLWAVQTEEYAACFRDLGVPAERVRVTGSIKYDGVEADRHNPRTRQLRELFAIADDDLVWIAGSTQHPEEQVVLDIYCRLRKTHPALRLFLVPRQKERFDEVARLLEHSGLAWIRRSQLQGALSRSPCHLVTLSPCHEVVLVDTIGELGALWGLADVAYVGGSLDGKRGGQNMIEPAGYGAAVLFGPHVWNFRDTVRRLLDADAALQIADAAELETVVARLLTDAGERARLGQNARRLVVQQQGATERTVALLEMPARRDGGTRRSVRWRCREK